MPRAGVVKDRIQLGPDLSLPLDVVTESVGILAVKRAGKSHTAKLLVEQLHAARQQVVIVDPKGDWWGIRSSADGKGPGLPIVIVGGEHADVPLEVGGGEVVARLVVEDRVSLLLDLSELRKHQVATFMTAFLETLYRMKAKDAYRTPLMLVVDEADAIAPQRPPKGEERMLGAAEDIVRRGGQRGIGITLVTQRAAVLNKNVLTQVGVLILLRTTGSQDIDAVDEWIKKHGQPEERAKVMATLATMARGTAWVWAPGWPDVHGIFKQVPVNPIRTFDSGATPKAGETRQAPKTLADVDLAALQKRMAATIERAKAEDPKALLARICELERAAAATAKVKTGPAPKEKVVERVVEVVPASMKEQVAALVRQCRGTPLEEMAEGLVAISGHIKAIADLAKTGPSAPIVRPAIATRYVTPPAPSRPQAVAASRPPRDTVHVTDTLLSGPEQRVLNALAELEAMRVSRPERVQVAFLAGYTNLNSKGFANAMGALSSAGRITYPGAGTVQLTDDGRQLAHPVDVPRTVEELQERVLRMLDGPGARILRPLLTSYPDALTRSDLGEASGYGNLNSKGFANAMGRLRSLGFIDYPATGQVVAARVLFLEGDD